MNFELMALRGALGVYALAGSLAIAGVVLRRSPQPWVFGLAVLGLAMHGVSLGVRWAQLGHGPFITMYEILSSNVWSLLAIFVLACWRYVALRPAAAIVLPLLFVMMAWLALQNPRAGHLPPPTHRVCTSTSDSAKYFSARCSSPWVSAESCWRA